MYTLEMAMAHMRDMQEVANRSRTRRDAARHAKARRLAARRRQAG
jgi:hypothetical protein